MLQTSCLRLLQCATRTQHQCIFQMHTSIKKRFYKNVSIVQSNGSWEVNLDQRKLKTPLGSPLKIESEFLAQAVANEWQAQKDVILLSQMHINGLVNTSLDNPGRLEKARLVRDILDFVETDTVLFYGEEPPELLELQTREWSPIIRWFRERFQVPLDPVVGISAPTLSPENFKKLEKHFMSYSMEALHGFMFGVDATKSIILTLACMERRLTVEEAVKLARLELLFQTDHWGTVEWAHDIEQHDTTSRLAAATLFVQFLSEKSSTKTKNIQ